MFPQQANEAINTEPDLNDPAVLAQLLAEDAQALETQAMASGCRASAYGGIPNPEFFYRRCAAHMKAAAAQLRPPTDPNAPVPKQSTIPHLTGAAVAAETHAWEPGTSAPDKRKKS